MSKLPTNKCPYKSRYSDGYVRPDQYILELICEKKARCEKKDLPRKFWNDTEWSAFFRRYLRQVQKLLKTYDHKAVIRAYKSDESGWAWSPFTSKMKSLIESEQATVNKQNRNIQEMKETAHIKSSTEADKPSLPRVPQPNKLNKLLKKLG